MRQNIRNILLLNLILGILVVLMTTLGFSTMVAKAEEGIIYTSTVNVTGGETYSFGNNGTILTAPTLQEIFDHLEANTPQGFNCIVNFDQVTTADSFVLNYSHQFVIKGKITYTGNGTFITVKTNKLKIDGVNITASDSAIWVESKGEMLMESGTIASYVSDYKMTATLTNMGKITINSGTIRYESTTGKGTGVALQQLSPNAETNIIYGAFAGNSCIKIDQGGLTITDGTFNALYSSSTNVANGYALSVNNNGIVTINGGKFGSVTPDHAIILEGTSLSALYFNGGEVNGKITFAYGTDGTTLYVDSRKLKPNLKGNIYLFAEGENLTPDNAKIGITCANGYYLKSWSENITTTNPYISDFGTVNNITATLDNSYQITLKMGDKSESFLYTYGSEVYPSGKGFLAPQGYSLLYWEDENHTKMTLPLVIDGTHTYTGVLALENPVLSPIEDKETTYDGNPILITPTITNKGNYTYTYNWEREVLEEKEDLEGNIDEEWVFVTVANTTDLSLLTVADSGVYRLTVSASDGKLSSKAISDSFSVTIDKGNYSGIVHRELTGSYNPDLCLADYELDEYFAWVDCSIIPDCLHSQYEATYCDDYDNMNQTTVIVNLILAKGTIQNGYYGEYGGNHVYSPTATLADYPLKENWEWKDDTIIPTAGKKSYDAYYNPDTANYQDLLTSVELVISKAEYTTDIAPLYFTVPYDYNLRLVEAFAYNEDERYFIDIMSLTVLAEMPELGEYNFPVYYNEDKENYVDGIASLTIEVVKGQKTAEYQTSLTCDYNVGVTLAQFLLQENWRWVDDSIVISVGENSYDALYNPDPEYFQDYLTSITVNMKVEEGKITYPDITATYFDGIALCDIGLEEGFCWKTPETKLVVGEFLFDVQYSQKSETEEEKIDYFDLTVKVKVEKGVIDMSGVKPLPVIVTYDGQPHFIGYEGTLPQGVSLKSINYGETTANCVDAGEYELFLLFEQEDNTNYLPVISLSATLTILKADYDMSGVVVSGSTVTYDGLPHQIAYDGYLPEGVSIVGYENNDQINAGSYEVSLLFGGEDQVNYNLIQPIKAVLTILKAESRIIAEEKQYFSYDGNPKVPQVVVDNQEQLLQSDITYPCIESGRYNFRFVAEESPNYKESTKNITMYITYPIIGATGDYTTEKPLKLSGTVSNNNSLVKGELAINVVDMTQNNAKIDVSLDNLAIEGEYTLTLMLTKGMVGKNIKVYRMENDSKIECTATQDNGILTITALGREFLLECDEDWIEEDNSQLKGWIIALLVICSIMLIAGIAFGVLLWKKDRWLIAVLGKIKSVLTKIIKKKE